MRMRPSIGRLDHRTSAGLEVVRLKENRAYQFISDNAQGATKKFGVKSVSILARKP